MGSASSAHERYILHMLTTRHSVLEHRGCACVCDGSASRPCALRLMRVGLGCLLNTLLVGRATYARVRSTSPRAYTPGQSYLRPARCMQHALYSTRSTRLDSSSSSTSASMASMLAGAACTASRARLPRGWAVSTPLRPINWQRARRMGGGGRNASFGGCRMRDDRNGGSRCRQRAAVGRVHDAE